MQRILVYNEPSTVTVSHSQCCFALYRLTAGLVTRACILRITHCVSHEEDWELTVSHFEPLEDPLLLTSTRLAGMHLGVADYPVESTAVPVIGPTTY